MARTKSRRRRKKNISTGGKVALAILGVAAAGGAAYGGYRLYQRRKGVAAIDGVPQRIPFPEDFPQRVS